MQISLIQVPYSEKLALLIDCYITPVPSRQCLCTFFYWYWQQYFIKLWKI